MNIMNYNAIITTLGHYLVFPPNQILIERNIGGLLIE